MTASTDTGHKGDTAEFAIEHRRFARKRNCESRTLPTSLSKEFLNPQQQAELPRIANLAHRLRVLNNGSAPKAALPASRVTYCGSANT